MPIVNAVAQRFAPLLLEWYRQFGRSLPWRGLTDPYPIWLSEVVLQQTRVDQGTAYYHRLLERFPTVWALADAPEADVLKAWEGLGYYSRARHLHRTAQAIVELGQWPHTVAELQRLPGIGPYTARAIASLAFGVQVAVVDGNVFRVLSRVLDDATPIDAATARVHFQTQADALLTAGPAPAGDFNQALMDLGATVCTPRSPLCTQCPVSNICRAYAHGRVAERPVRGKAAERPERCFDATLVFDADGRLVVHQRQGPGVWRGLYELPTTEVARFKRPPPGARERLRLRHEFSHYRMLLRVLELPVDHYPPQPADRWVTRAELEALAFPRAWRKAFDQLFQVGLFDG